MKFSYRLLLAVILTAITALLSACGGGGGGSYSVYSGYGYPYYGHGVGYKRVNYNDNFDNRRERRTERIDTMSPGQRQQASDSLRQNQPQRVERRQASRASNPARNMGRPRTGGRRR